MSNFTPPASVANKSFKWVLLNMRKFLHHNFVDPLKIGTLLSNFKIGTIGAAHWEYAIGSIMFTPSWSSSSSTLSHQVWNCSCFAKHRLGIWFHMDGCLHILHCTYVIAKQFWKPGKRLDRPFTLWSLCTSLQSNWSFPIQFRPKRLAPSPGNTNNASSFFWPWWRTTTITSPHVFSGSLVYVRSCNVLGFRGGGRFPHKRWTSLHWSGRK